MASNAYKTPEKKKSVKAPLSPATPKQVKQLHSCFQFTAPVSPVKASAYNPERIAEFFQSLDDKAAGELLQHACQKLSEDQAKAALRALQVKPYIPNSLYMVYIVICKNVTVLCKEKRKSGWREQHWRGDDEPGDRLHVVKVGHTALHDIHPRLCEDGFSVTATVVGPSRKMKAVECKTHCTTEEALQTITEEWCQDSQSRVHGLEIGATKCKLRRYHHVLVQPVFGKHMKNDALEMEKAIRNLLSVFSYGLAKSTVLDITGGSPTRMGVSDWVITSNGRLEAVTAFFSQKIAAAAAIKERDTKDIERHDLASGAIQSKVARGDVRVFWKVKGAEMDTEVVFRKKVKA